MIKIQLPIKALSVNQAWAGRRFPTKAYKQYKKDMAILLSPHRQRRVGGMVGLTINFYYKNYKRTDVDSGLKQTLDALVQNNIIDDDKYVQWVHINKYPAKDDSIEIEIYRYDE